MLAVDADDVDEHERNARAIWMWPEIMSTHTERFHVQTETLDGNNGCEMFRVRTRCEMIDKQRR